MFAICCMVHSGVLRAWLVCLLGHTAIEDSIRLQQCAPHQGCASRCRARPPWPTVLPISDKGTPTADCSQIPVALPSMTAQTRHTPRPTR